jgi:glycosyltransferase involved in cell wall biosynthesis
MKPESLVRFLNCMDVLAVPSLTTPTWKEQYGRIIAEAMACGVTVVGSDSGAIPEVIESAGIVVPENSSDDLAEAMRTVIDDASARAAFEAGGLERARQHLSTTAMAANLLRFYDRVLGS